MTPISGEFLFSFYACKWNDGIAKTIVTRKYRTRITALQGTKKRAIRRKMTTNGNLDVK